MQLLWFAQNYYECGSFAQICPHVFPGSLPHKDIGLGKVMRVPGCSKLANFTGSWRNFLYNFQKGLDGLHSDKSAANNCNLRQWRSPEPSCLPYIVLDDRFPVIDSNMRMQCHCATQIRTALLLQQRRWDRPLGTAHFANSDKSAANICKLRQWRSQQPSCLAFIENMQFPWLVRAQLDGLDVSNTSPLEWSLYLALVSLILSLRILDSQSNQEW